MTNFCCPKLQKTMKLTNYRAFFRNNDSNKDNNNLKSWKRDARAWKVK